MSSCCSSDKESQNDSCCSTEAPRKAPCPACGHECLHVDSTTLIHQLHAPFNQQLEDGSYYFCPSSTCDVVYFDLQGGQYTQAQLRQEVGQKSQREDRTLCYCFDVHADQVAREIEQNGNSSSKAFVVAMTKAKRCACDIRNPSGQCCLKDFPK